MDALVRRDATPKHPDAFSCDVNHASKSKDERAESDQLHLLPRSFESQNVHIFTREEPDNVVVMVTSRSVLHLSCVRMRNATTVTQEMGRRSLSKAWNVPTNPVLLPSECNVLFAPPPPLFTPTPHLAAKRFCRSPEETAAGG